MIISSFVLSTLFRAFLNLFFSQHLKSPELAKYYHVYFATYNNLTYSAIARNIFCCFEWQLNFNNIRLCWTVKTSPRTYSDGMVGGICFFITAREVLALLPWQFWRKLISWKTAVSLKPFRRRLIMHQWQHEQKQHKAMILLVEEKNNSAARAAHLSLCSVADKSSSFFHSYNQIILFLNRTFLATPLISHFAHIVQLKAEKDYCVIFLTEQSYILKWELFLCEEWIFAISIKKYIPRTRVRERSYFFHVVQIGSVARSLVTSLEPRLSILFPCRRE